jgi:hypothetical protein
LNRGVALIAALTASTCIPASAWAQTVEELFTPNVTPGSAPAGRDETRAYIGLAWQFGPQSPGRPDVVLGIQSVRVKPDDGLTGVDLNARIGLDGRPARIALSGLFGNRTAFANLGVGYDFRAGGPIGTVGLQVPRARGGIDIALKTGQFRPYVELNTLDAPEVAAAGSPSTLSCSTPNYLLATRDQLNSVGQDVFDQFIVPSNLDVNGVACVDAGLLA